jgi:hypothetical protein
MLTVNTAQGMRQVMVNDQTTFLMKISSPFHSTTCNRLIIWQSSAAYSTTGKPPSWYKRDPHQRFALKLNR